MRPRFCHGISCDIDAAWLEALAESNAALLQTTRDINESHYLKKGEKLMAETDVKKKDQTAGRQHEQQSGQPRQTNQPSSGMQTRGQWPQGGGLTHRGALLPSMLSLNPRDLWNTSPFELMRRFTDEMDHVFSGFGLSSGASGHSTAMWTPTVEVFERDNHLIVHAELPGLNKDDVKVEMTDDGLVIQGERKREHEERQEGFYRSERSYGQFYRLIPLPEEAQVDQAKAQFENGVLEITVPIPAAQQRHRSIPIEIGGSHAKHTTQAAGGQTQTATGGSSKK